MHIIATQFNLSFTFKDILIVLLLIAAIAVLVLLAKVLFSVSKTLKTVNGLVEDNKDSLDRTLADLPGITNKVDGILVEADGLVKEIKPNLVVTLGEVEGISKDVHRLSTDAVDTVEYVAMTAVDTVDNITTGVSSATNYIELGKSILTSIKSFIR